MNAKAIVFEKPFTVSIGEVRVPEIKDDEILVQTLYTGVSTGTELRILRGEETNASKFPLIPGYSLVGKVIEKGKKVRKLSREKLVFTTNVNFFHEYASGWGAHLSHAVCKSQDVIIIPQDVNPVAATFTAVLAVACHGVLRVKPQRGESVAIVGQGLIGLLASQVFKNYGTKVVALDIRKTRLMLAKRLGIDYIIDLDEGKSERKFRTLFPRGVDIAVDASGTQSGLNEATMLAKDKSWDNTNDYSPRLLLLGSYAGGINFDYSSFLFSKEPDIYTSRASTISDKKEALRLLSKGKVMIKEMAPKIYNYTRAQSAYQNLMTNKECISIVFEWK
ncbi:MAG: zinc-binding alcohol dehydrogenase [Planctomycetes bacterium]|nr:zinc-binding alcohol dehydrogenase [Planctomycetota bacterium]